MFCNVFIQVLEGHTSCRDLSAPWAWMSTYSSIELQLWSTLVCAGNDTRLEETLLSSLLPVTEKVWAGHFKFCYCLTTKWKLAIIALPKLNVFSQVQQLVGVVNGTVMYNVTPSTVMSEWHSLYTTSLQYVSALQNLQTEVNENYFAAWIPGNISDGLSQILLTRSET